MELLTRVPAYQLTLLLDSLLGRDAGVCHQCAVPTRRVILAALRAKEGASAQTQDLMDRHAVVRDLRLQISAALHASPVYEPSLRRVVREYVGAERRACGPPGYVIDVIIKLIDLIERSDLAPAAVRQALTRRVIVWCVEAYFGPVGGDGTRRDGDALSDAPLDAVCLVASNR